jgi:hypothetical protein
VAAKTYIVHAWLAQSFCVFLARATKHKENAAPTPLKISGFQTGMAQQSRTIQAEARYGHML